MLVRGDTDQLSGTQAREDGITVDWIIVTIGAASLTQRLNLMQRAA